MGESASTESQPSKLCSWILFPLGSQVKEKSRAKIFGRKLLVSGDLRERSVFHKDDPKAEKAPFRA